MKTKKCRVCGKILEKDGKFINSSHSEKKAGKLTRWKHWCEKCYNEKFINDIAGYPSALAKYYDIHGKHPKEVIGA